MTSTFKPVSIIDYAQWSKLPQQRAFARTMEGFHGVYDPEASGNLETFLSSFQELLKRKPALSLLKLEAMLSAQCIKQGSDIPQAHVAHHLIFVHLAMATLLVSCPDIELRKIIARLQIPWARYCLHEPQGILNLEHGTWRLFFWISYSVSTMTVHTRDEIRSRVQQVLEVMDKPRSIRTPQIEAALAIARDHERLEMKRMKSIDRVAKRWQGNIKIIRAKNAVKNLLAPPLHLGRVPEIAVSLVETYGQPYLLNRLLKFSVESGGELDPQAQLVLVLMGRIYQLGSNDGKSARLATMGSYKEVRPFLEAFGFDLKIFDAFIQDMAFGKKINFRCIETKLPAEDYAGLSDIVSPPSGSHFKVSQDGHAQILRLVAVNEPSGRLLLTDLPGISLLDVTGPEFVMMQKSGEITSWNPYSNVCQAARRIVAAARQSRPVKTDLPFCSGTA